MNARLPERIQPDSGPYADESLAHWATIYHEREVRTYGVLFEVFMSFPRQIIDAIDHGRLRRLDQSDDTGDTSMHTSTPEERAAVLAALQHHIGRAAGVTARALVAEVKALRPAHDISERDLRVIVTELRLDGQHICAHPSHGYFIAETPEELEETVAFLRHRALSGLRQIAAMNRISMPDLCGQLHLPT